MSVCVHYGLVATEQIREYLSKLCLSLNTTSARACNAELRQNENRNAIRSSRIRERIENKQIANETTQMHGKNQCLRRAIASNAFFINMFECCFPFTFTIYMLAYNRVDLNGCAHSWGKMAIARVQHGVYRMWHGLSSRVDIISVTTKAVSVRARASTQNHLNDFLFSINVMNVRPTSWWELSRLGVKSHSLCSESEACMCYL